MSTAIQNIKEIIDTNQVPGADFKNFILQGGAGSGKTESLKEIISYIAGKYPDKSIACITHTNVAADEIRQRVGNNYEISTIHSFLNSLIKRYKRNLKEIIAGIFEIDTVSEEIHDAYKKGYEKYSSKLYSISKLPSNKVTGKKEYDKSPSVYNNSLNADIASLNKVITAIIENKDHNSIEYNETRFNSFEDLTFSHDSLLKLSHMLSLKFPLLPKIISDKYDFIFIDEYQDTNELIIDLFLNLLPKKQTTIGLFGDSMQGIYDDGIGDVEGHIQKGTIMKIDKKDNFRCSDGVIRFINTLRNDKIEQELALKKGETPESRTGTAKVVYSVIDNKPSGRSTAEEKRLYSDKLATLIKDVKTNYAQKGSKILVLTNKSISDEAGFPNLYRIFDERFSEVREEIERELAKIQVSEIAALCNLFQNKKYNELIVRLKKNGFRINSAEDKNLITVFFNEITSGSHSLLKTLNMALENKFLKKSEKSVQYFFNRDEYLKGLDSDPEYLQTEGFYIGGGNTQKRLKELGGIELSNEEFLEFERKFKKKRFYLDLFSDDLKFTEVLKYQNYLNEETEYITMHKTKGTGIENVIVVLDEYFWTKYNFKSIYDPMADAQRRTFNQKLFYVASSRAIKNLIAIRIVEGLDEEKLLKEYFQTCDLIRHD